MIGFFMALLGAIPGIGAVITGVSSAVLDSRVRITMARYGATRDVAVSMIQASATEYQTRALMMGTIAGSKVLTWLVVAFAVPIVAYEFKCVVWDTMLDLGTTAPIKGSVAEWMNTIINWLFGSSTALAAGQMALRAVNK